MTCTSLTARLPRGRRLVRHQSISCLALQDFGILFSVKQEKHQTSAVNSPAIFAHIFSCPFDFHNFVGNTLAKSCQHSLM